MQSSCTMQRSHSAINQQKIPIASHHILSTSIFHINLHGRDQYKVVSAHQSQNRCTSMPCISQMCPCSVSRLSSPSAGEQGYSIKQLTSNTGQRNSGAFMAPGFICIQHIMVPQRMLSFHICLGTFLPFCWAPRAMAEELDHAHPEGDSSMFHLTMNPPHCSLIFYHFS